jgi:hypothetical protein
LRTIRLLHGDIDAELFCVWVLVPFAILLAQDSGFDAAILRLSVSILRYENTNLDVRAYMYDSAQAHAVQALTVSQWYGYLVRCTSLRELPLM